MKGSLSRAVPWDFGLEDEGGTFLNEDGANFAGIRGGFCADEGEHFEKKLREEVKMEIENETMTSYNVCSLPWMSILRLI